MIYNLAFNYQRIIVYIIFRVYQSYKTFRKHYYHIHNHITQVMIVP